MAGRVIFTALLLIGLGCRKPQPSAIERLARCQMEEGPTDGYCGKLPVFENRETRTGRKINLKIVVLPALKRESRPDPLFVLAGGPGQGAAKMAAAFSQIFRTFQNDRDIVLVDQRGTGDSNPLNCKPPDRDEDDLSKLGAYPMEQFRKCLAGYDAEPGLYTTPVAMDDLEDVRLFLGYGKINVWGGSYGTRAALVFLRRHPDSVRTVVLDGVAPTGMRLPLFASRDGQRALDLLIRDCEADPGCRARFPALRTKVAALLAHTALKPRVRLTHPRTGERGEVIFTRELFASILFGALYSPALSALLPRLLEDAAAGDYQGLLALGFAGEATSDDPISQGMFLSVVCSEDRPYITRAEIEAETKNTFFGSTMFDTRLKPCEFWPRAEIAAGYHDAVKSDVPVLIFSGELDPITPPVWGEQAKRSLRNSRHIVVPGTGHGTIAAGCVPRLTARFLDEASVAGLDESCVRNLHRPPFFVNYSGPAGKAER